MVVSIQYTTMVNVTKIFLWNVTTSMVNVTKIFLWNVTTSLHWVGGYKRSPFSVLSVSHPAIQRMSYALVWNMTCTLEKVFLSAGDSSSSRTTLDICLFGAHITSWKYFSNFESHDYDEYLWMSTLSALDGTAPIRGGIPIAFPQFADNGPMKLHGFARESMWTVVSRATTLECDEIQLTLSNDSNTANVWNYPYSFHLTLTVELRVESLKMILSVRNDSDTESLPFTGCFHTYFRTPDIDNITIQGLQDLTYIDKVDSYQSKTHITSPFHVSDELSSPQCLALSNGQYFLDRVYQPPPGTPCPLTLTDTGAERVFVVEKSASWPEWVLFNPWREGKRGPKGPDFDDDGYKHMICLEPSAATQPVIVPPGKVWHGEQIISVTRGRGAESGSNADMKM